MPTLSATSIDRKGDDADRDEIRVTEIGDIIGAILAIAGLVLVIIGLALLVSFPRNIEDIVRVAKGWVDGLKFLGIGLVVLLAGVGLLKMK